MCTDTVRRVAFGMLLICVLGIPNDGLAQSSPLQQLSAILPAGEGKTLVYKHCVACHGAALVRKRLEAGKGWPLRYWEDVVLQMIQTWGAPIETSEVTPISQYLERVFATPPPDRRPGLDALLTGGPEKDLVLTRCAVCHDPETTARRMESRRGLPASAWDKLLVRMSAYGARLSRNDIDQLSTYLERELRSKSDTAEKADKNALESLAAVLPEGEGRSTVLAVCLSCHGPDELKRRIDTSPGADPYYWERVVKRMKSRWEAPLEEQDVDVTIKYLNSLAAK